MYIQLLFSKQMWIYSLGITLQKMIPTSTIRTIEHSQLSRSHHHAVPSARIASTTSSSDRLRLANGRMADDNVHNNEAISEIIMASEINSLKVSSPAHCDEASMHTYRSNTQSTGRQGASDFDVDADDGNDRNNVLTSLEYVISCMSTQNLHNRASLMYLLDVSITIYMYNILHINL